MAESFAVIDTETTWYDEVMSIGVIISSFSDYSIKEKLYFVITPEYKEGGMFSYQLKNTRGTEIEVTKRKNAIKEINNILKKSDVKYIFAYNANFDYRHLPELSRYIWIDIMRIAAYRQYNEKLPDNLDYCSSGRLRSGYGVECMYSYLFGDDYEEAHNAVCDAEDELEIMKMLNKDLELYMVGAINAPELVEQYKKTQDMNYGYYSEPKKEETIRHSVIEEKFLKILSDPFNMNNDTKNTSKKIEDIHNGDKVYHITFGEGEVLDISNRKMCVIKFTRIEKTLNIDYAIENGYISLKPIK